MKPTWKDGVATALVAVVVVVYVGYLSLEDGLPLVRDIRGMAAVGLILGFASRRIGGRRGIEHERVAFAAGLASMALGILALVTESELVLALFIVSIAALGAAATYVRTGHHIGGIRLSP
jgi:hypothetical protein